MTTESSRIAEIIIQFCREHGRFHAYELRDAVTRADAAPGSADRGLRALRQQGVINYRVISRHDSLYEVTAINAADAEESAAMEVLSTASLAELEAIIAKGMASFIETGNAVREIRDRRLYREQGFATFEEYCLKRWRFGRNYVNKQIAAVMVVENLGTTVPNVITERQARELAYLSPERQREVAATIDFQHTTAAQIRDLVRQELPAAKPKTKSSRNEHEFCLRLFNEFMRRRKEADIVSSKRVWKPDAIGKLDLINIIVWMEGELQNYLDGPSAKRREKAKKRPQPGKGIDHDHESKLYDGPADAGASTTV